MICEYTEILDELKRKIADLGDRRPSAGRLHHLMSIAADMEELTGKFRADVLERVSRDIVLDAEEGIDYTGSVGVCEGSAASRSEERKYR